MRFWRPCLQRLARKRDFGFDCRAYFLEWGSRASLQAQGGIECQDDLCDLGQIYLEVRGRFTCTTRTTWISRDVDGVGAAGTISVDFIWGGGIVAKVELRCFIVMA